MNWLATAEAYGYLSAAELREIRGRLNSIGKGLEAMMSKPETFIPRAVAVRPPSSALRRPSSVLGPPASGLNRPSA